VRGPGGSLYNLRSNNFHSGGTNGDGVEGVVDVFSLGGASKKKGMVAGLCRGDCGLGGKPTPSERDPNPQASPLTHLANAPADAPGC